MLPKRHSAVVGQNDVEIPRLPVRWFHAVDVPLVDPIAERVKKRSASGISSGSTSSLSSTTTTVPSKPPKQPASWLPFSKRDSNALEKAYLSDDPNPKVSVNEDYLFEVDVAKRAITPVFWEGPVYEVRRATWFIQGDSSKWLPCEENLSEQIELGYCKYRPWIPDPVIPPTTETQAQPASSDTKSNAPGSPQLKPTAIPKTSRPVTPQPQVDSVDSTGSNEAAITVEEKKLEKTLEKQPEKHWNLLGRYLEQHVIYTGPATAWLLSDSFPSKVTKQIFTRLTNNNNLGGTRLLRGYPEVEKTVSTSTTSAFSRPKQPTVDEAIKQPPKGEKSEVEEILTDNKEDEETTQARRQVEDYDNEESESERKVDHLVFVIHGIGQKFADRLGQNFIHDVNLFRRTIKSAYTSVTGSTNSLSRPNGIQVLPILWRQDITFGMAAESDKVEHDLGMPEMEDGQPTLEEITLEGVPNIRMIVSDVLLDIPLYMTPRYREQMMAIVAKEINRVYHLFINRNPNFLLNGGKISIYGYSLGSVLAFDILVLQPLIPNQDTTKSDNNSTTSNSYAVPHQSSNSRLPVLDFPVVNFFCVGSPVGLLLLLKGCKIASRKLLSISKDTAASSASSDAPQIPFCYPAVQNLYNIFHKADPVAYRLEPLIARHYTANLKPELIPYSKGGLKGVIDAGYNVGSDIATRAGAVYEQIRTGLAVHLFMRNFGLKKGDLEASPTQQAQSRSASPQRDGSGRSPARSRSNSDPLSAVDDDAADNGSHIPPVHPEPLMQITSYSLGAQRLRALNTTGRVDYCLQEGLLENAYLSALNVHMGYWQDIDVSAFVIREIYRTAESSV